MDEKLQKVHLTESKPITIDSKQFDLFHMENSTPEEQREFELWWNKWTGRSAIVISGVDYIATLPYPESKE